MESTTTALLLINAFLLGLRHGVDWDHIAAILDIVGSATNSSSDSPCGDHRLARSAAPVLLSTFYACGHAFVVLLLGIAAICFAAILPTWIDPIMERVVGLTLIILGVYVIYSLYRYWCKQGDFQLKSRWMLLFSIMESWLKKSQPVKATAAHDHSLPVQTYSMGTAFGVGMIHGIGAETGTQVLLIATVGGSSESLGLLILLSFVVGLVCSNTVLAVLASTGFTNSSRTKSLYAVTGAVTAAFSLAIGVIFVSGMADRLPDLQTMLKAGVLR